MFLRLYNGSERALTIPTRRLFTHKRNFDFPHTYTVVWGCIVYSMLHVFTPLMMLAAQSSESHVYKQ